MKLLDFRKAQTSLAPSAEESDNSLVVTNSAHASICTEKVKHPREVTIKRSAGGLQTFPY